MALVAAKCTECGASIEVEDTKDAGICNFCGTAFVTQKIINEHHTHVTKHITKNVFGVDGKSAEDFCEKAKTFIKLNDWDKAKEVYESATKIDPSSYLGWLGLVKWHTRNFLDFNDEYHIEYLDKAIAVANDNERKIIENELSAYNEKLLTGTKNKIKDYQKMVNVANDAHKKRLLYSILLFGVFVPLIFTIVLCFLYFVFAKTQTKASILFYESVYDVNRLERQAKRFDVTVPIVIKKWNDEKLAIKIPILYRPIDREEFMARIRVFAS